MNDTIRISRAQERDAGSIDQIRHQVYAAELGQYAPTVDQTLHDRDEVESLYLAAFDGEELIGFVGITSPDSPRYSIEKHVALHELAMGFDEGLYEIRALTVIDQARGSRVAAALMYAAFRWIQEQGGEQVVAMGHQKVRAMYLRLGMRPVGAAFQCGELEYEPLAASVDDLESELTRFDARLKRLEQQVVWDLEIPFRPQTECYHGGAFFEAIGDAFEHLEQRNEIINADVLDAWYPPCPDAQQALHEHLGWLARTSPPNHAEGLVRTIAETRGVATEHVLPGGGSSPLIFLAFREWLTPKSRALILDPTYGEYAHVLERVVGCQVERFKLHREDGYMVDTAHLADKLQEGFDLMVWVNPNSPTGRHVQRAEVEAVLRAAPQHTKIWIDETYIEYFGAGQSLERFAARSQNVVVVKSMSKVYGLSGLRVGYLCGPRRLIEPLRGLMPPWSVSLPAQVAAVRALRAPAYYEERHRETQVLREQLSAGLRALGITELIPGGANFLLFHLPPEAPDGATVVDRCRARGLFVRDAAEMGTGMGDRAIRIAVKDPDTNERMLDILNAALALKEVCHES